MMFEEISTIKKKPKNLAVVPLIPALKRHRQVNLCEFKDSLVYRGSSRTTRATQRNPVSKKEIYKVDKMVFKGKETHQTSRPVVFSLPNTATL